MFRPRERPEEAQTPRQLSDGRWVGCQHYVPPDRPDSEAARNWIGPEPHEHDGKKENE